MTIYIAIDDTDSVDVGATGQSANALRKIIKDKGWGECQPVTRHQLLLHPDIPYTSHNSSMCFVLEHSPVDVQDLIRCAAEFLENTSAPGSDPGLCVAVSTQIKDVERLISFGIKAKKEIVSKQEAYQTAEYCGVHLSEHGGTGLGIIGALAGVALRMTGNDGRFQGKMQLKESGEPMTIGEVIENTEIDEVQSIEGQTLRPDDIIIIGDKIKTVLLDGKRKLLVYRKNGAWHTCTNKHLQAY
mgnify:CR=1 FL=1